MPTPREEMRIVAVRLQALNVPFAFVGGAVMYFLVDNPEVTEFRRTIDVDVVVSAVTYLEFSNLEERLRNAEFMHDRTEGAPICRWIVAGVKVDIMPQQSANLGMNTRWFPEVLEFAVDTDLGDGCTAKVVSPTLFLATKLEAFHDRGHDDYYGSHDLEDIVTLIDGRASIVRDVATAPDEIRRFISGEFTRFLQHSDFRDALPGHLSSLFGGRQRSPSVFARIDSISAL